MIGDQTYEHGDSQPLSFTSPSTLNGILRSSNKEEQTSVYVNIPSLGISKTLVVQFSGGTIEVDLGTGELPFVAAGTADRSHWSNMVGATSHAELDVLPFIRACQLDGNAVTGTWLNRNLTRPIMHSETYVGKYLEVRPVLAEPSRQIAPGTPCP